MLKKRAPYDKKQNYIVETKAVSNTKSGPPIVAISRKGGGFEKSGAPEICDDQPHKISNVKAWDTLPINGDFMQKVAILSQILAIFWIVCTDKKFAQDSNEQIMIQHGKYICSAQWAMSVHSGVKPRIINSLSQCSYIYGVQLNT